MLLGVLYGVLAGALWGLIYVAPLFVPDYHPVLVALGRFLVFGAIAVPFILAHRDELKAFPIQQRKEAFYYAFFGNVLFYSCLTVCIRLAGAPLAGMFTAMIPVFVAMVANVKYTREGRGLAWSKIVPPLVLMFAGLIIANITEFQHFTDNMDSPVQYWTGVGFGLISIVAWTWFSIMNGEFLLQHKDKSTKMWTALQGASTLPIVTVIFAICAWGLDWMPEGTGTLSFFGPRPWVFLGTIFMVGYICSWVAMLCWNRMSQRLPSGLGGQLIVFEAISSLIYAMLWRREWPTVTMVVGFMLLLVGVFASLYVFRQATERLQAKPINVRPAMTDDEDLDDEIESRRYAQVK